MSAMENKTLTHRQRQVLTMIHSALASQGAPPTVRELREGLKLKSLRGVTIHLDALVRKGYISRSRQARGIRLLDPQRGRASKPTPVPTLLPVVGRIAAGAPLLAEEHIEEHLAVDLRWVPGPGCFALRIHGESMTGAGIENGDYVVIRPQAEAHNGEVVAVLIEGEATVKRFYRERGGRIRLQPDNPTLEPLFIHPKEQSTRILGKVVGLFRKF